MRSLKIRSIEKLPIFILQRSVGGGDLQDDNCTPYGVSYLTFQGKFNVFSVSTFESRWLLVGNRSPAGGSVFHPVVNVSANCNLIVDDIRSTPVDLKNGTLRLAVRAPAQSFKMSNYEKPMARLT
jgi:hypothetical protein